jgi:hypothetical protein
LERTGALQVAFATFTENDLAGNAIGAKVAHACCIEAPISRCVFALRGIWYGAAGGLMGAAAMILFADGWNCLAGRRRIRLGTEEEAEAAGKVVDIVTRRVLHTHLRPDMRQQAVMVFHFAFGTLAGAAYGAVAVSLPAITAGAGAPFGAVEWLLGNKLTAPQFGLLKPRRRYSKQERLQTLASHVVFGVVTEMTRSRLCKRFRS